LDDRHRAGAMAETCMIAIGYALFETAIGACAIAWSDAGVVALQLPEADEKRTRARLLKRWPHAQEEAPPLGVERAIGGIVGLLSGKAADQGAVALDTVALDTVALDMERVPGFDRQVYEVARTIAPGETLTYGDIAARLGDPAAAREVGQALGRNPFAIIVPCHRVVAAGGKTGGFSANGGVDTKLRLLEIERARLGREPTLFDRDDAFARLQRRG
jgi:methylated-DNA-[protein]-cysteine S-methyltransferase